MQKTELIKKAAAEIIAKVPQGYGMTQDEAEIYAAAALSFAEEKAVEVKDVLTIVGADGREWVPKDALLAALVDVPAVESEPVATVEIHELEGRGGCRGLGYIQPENWWLKLPAGTYFISASRPLPTPPSPYGGDNGDGSATGTKGGDA